MYCNVFCFGELALKKNHYTTFSSGPLRWLDMQFSKIADILRDI